MKTLPTRRDFIKLAGAAGGGLVLAVYLDACASAPAPGTVAAPTPSGPTPAPTFDWSPNLYLKIDNNGTVTVTAFRSDMGQGIRTALAMLAAEELDLDWSSVVIVQAPADARYGDQLTGGSVSISTYHSGMRLAGAVARAMLVAAAAQRWDVAPADCRTEAGVVIHPDGVQTLTYGELAEPASKLDVPSRAPIKDASGFRILGRDVGHWDAPQMVTGQAVYGLDVRVPGMLFAALARCPVFGGTLVSFEDGAALAVPGVRKVVPIQDKVAVVADTSWSALRGREALIVEWEQGVNAGLDSETLRAAAAGRLPDPGSDSSLLDAVYEMPFEAHATMEPMNCTAHVHDGVCEVWAPSQNPQDAQLKAAAAAGLRTEAVTVHVPLIGGAFGRRLQSDFVVEAVLVSQAAGAPVQVVWSRDDDLQHDYYRDLTVLYASVPRDTVSLPRVQPAGSRSNVPTGAWRSVDNFPQAYATGCFIDEMAAALERDPLDLLLELYSGRAAAVIRLAAEKAGWGEPLPEGRGRGLAYHATFGVTHVAYVAEVAVAENGRVRVPRVVAAVDCGQVINPDTVRAQVEGGIVFGLTAALKSEAVIKEGRIQQSNFHDFPILRMDEMPVVEVHLIESGDRPSGMGEMGVPPIAPAVANAVFAATGKRIRHIPIRPEDLTA